MEILGSGGLYKDNENLVVLASIDDIDNEGSLRLEVES